MNAIQRAALGLVVVLWAAAAGAQSTDLQAIRTIVTLAPACTGSPVQNQQACLSVVVKNNGPDTYGGAAAAKPASPQAGTLQVSVDIDEPTKPGEPEIDAGPFVREFVVTLAPGDSIQLDYGPVNYYPATPGTHAARLTVTALAPYTDPTPGNNQSVTVFTVLPRLPAAGWPALGALAVLLVTGSWIAVRRLRARPV